MSSLHVKQLYAKLAAIKRILSCGGPPMKKKSIAYVLFLVLVSLTGALAYLYYTKQKETVALQLKLQLSEAGKKKPVPWHELLVNIKDVQEGSKPVPAGQAEVEASNQPESLSEAPIAISEQRTDTLARQVEFTLKNREKLSLESINDGIEIAEELIEREPSSYSAYKAKLILLLTKEAAHLESIDDADVENLLDEMATFDVTSEIGLRKEAFLITRTDARIDRMEDDLDELEEELTDIDFDLEFVEEDSEEETALLDEALTIEEKIDEREDEIDRLEDELEAELIANETLINQDIIEIPMQRGLASANYDLVISEAEALLDEFGDSIIGYYYLIRALELSGQRERALDIITDSNLSASNSQELERRLRRSRSEDPKDYWKHLRF